jgi:type-2 restriction enzyme hindII
MNVNYDVLAQKLQGMTIPKPLSGTLSGHAAGEPFDKYVYAEIKKQYPNHTFRQYEYLNDLYSNHPTVIGFEARKALFNSPTVLFLLSRSKEATDKWTLDNLFEEKQNDTADILVVKKGFYELIDVKTRNIAKKAQAPNIISAYKLAQLCAKMLDNEEFDNFEMNYFEVDWLLENDELVCKGTHFGCLFKENPEELYINWAAAMQLQFHVRDLVQLFEGHRKEWAERYLKHFVNQAQKRANYMIERFVKPFQKYIEKL